MPEPVSIPGFELIEQIGAGSAGTVYKARQISMDRLVAIKILPPRYADDKRFIERFYQEARAVAKLNHPHIVTGIDVGSVGDCHYFVMEYVDGESLAARLDREGALKEAEALEFTRQIALALEHAYKNGIVHRDVKPANILVTRGGVAKLADLGVARRAESDVEASTGRVFGTPYYMSPEQARGSVDIDIRSDIYSLGATLYHLLSGKPPFHGFPPAVVMAKQIAEEPEDVRKLAPAVSKEAAELLALMMAKNPDDRPETPGDLVEEIKRVQKGRSPSKLRVQPGREARPSPRRAEVPAKKSRGAVLVAGGVGLVVVVAAVASALLVGSGKIETQALPAPGPGLAVPPPPSPTQASAPAAPAGEGVSAEDEARKDLEALRGKGLAPAEEAAALRRFVEKHRGTSAAEEAERRIEHLQTVIEADKKLRETKEKVAGLLAKARELAEQGRAKEALALLDPSSASGHERGELEEAVREVRGLLELKLLQAEAAAGKLASEGKFAEAREALSGPKGWGVPELSARVSQALAKIDEAEAARAKKLAAERASAAEKAYSALAEKLRAELRAFRTEEAEALLRSAESDPALAPVREWLAEDRAMVALVDEVLTHASRGASGLRGETSTFKMRDGSETSGVVRSASRESIEVESRLRGGSGAVVMRLEYAKLADETIANLAMRSLDKAAPATYAGLAALFASGGDLATARRHAETAKGLGAKVASVERLWLAQKPSAEPAGKVASAAESKGETGSGRKHTEAQPKGEPPKPSPLVTAELKKLERRATERYQVLKKMRAHWDIVQMYVRLEKFKEAALALAPMLKSRDPGVIPDPSERPWMDSAGEFELEYARILTYMGQTQLVPQLVADYQRKSEAAVVSPDPQKRPEPYYLRRLKAKKDFIAGFAAVKQKVDALTEELAQAPDGDKYWELAALCEPAEGKASLALKWFTTLLELKEKFPEHPRVKSGQVDFTLSYAYSHHELYEDAIAILESMPKKFPEFPACKDGYYLWELARAWENLGLMQEAARDKKAVTSLQKAIETYRQFKTGFPEHGFNQPDRNALGVVIAPVTDRYIARALTYLDRARRL